MTHVLITGSADGLGRIAAEHLLEQGHRVVIHARSRHRLDAVRELLDAGAEHVVADLSDRDQVRDLARQLHQLDALDAVIHNAGVMDGPRLLEVNVVAPWLLTTLVPSPRLVYLSSSMHRGGHPDAGLLHRPRQASYSDSKLLVTALAVAVARLRPQLLSNAVCPGWVPTRMGGPSAPDDLQLGARTQEWLATSSDPQALTSGGYWHHQQLKEPHPATRQVRFQDELLATLGDLTDTAL